MPILRLLTATGLAACLWTAVPAPVAAQIYVQVAPPPVIHEVVPAGRHGYLWVQGHYEWRRGRYVWVPGYWVRERRGYVYAQPYWEQRRSRWVYYGGNWAPQARDISVRTSSGTEPTWVISPVSRLVVSAC